MKWTEQDKVKALAWRAEGKSAAEIDVLLKRKPGTTMEMFRRAKRSPKQREAKLKAQRILYRRQNPQSATPTQARAQMRVSFDLETMARLRDFAQDCRKTPGEAVRDLVADLLKDDAREHGRLEAAE